MPETKTIPFLEGIELDSGPLHLIDEDDEDYTLCGVAVVTGEVCEFPPLEVPDSSICGHCLVVERERL